MNNSKQIRIGSILSYAQISIHILIGLLYTQIMIKQLGKNEYGLYNTIASSISMLSILSLGFNSGYIRYFTEYKKNKDEAGIKKLNALFLSIFLVIGFVAFICGIIMSFNLGLIFDKGLTESEYNTAYVLMILFTINMAISFPMSIFSNIISAHERFIFIKSMAIFKNVLTPLLVIPLLFIGYKSIAVIVMTIFVSVVTDIVYLFYAVKKLGVRFDFDIAHSKIFKPLFNYTIFIAINMIIDQINCNIDKILLGRFKGTATVAVYSVGFTLYHYYMMFSTAISGVFTPRVHKIIRNTEDENELKKELTSLFTKVGRIQFIMLALISSGIVFWGKSFIRLWAGKGYENSYYVALLLIIPGSIPLIQNIGIEIQRAENKHKFRSIIYLIMAICNLLLSIYLCQIYGAVGSAIGTAISFVLANGIIINIYYHKKCFINVIYFWKSISRMLLGMIIPFICGFIISKYLVVTSYIDLLLQACLYIVIYFIFMYLIGINDYEKSLIKQILIKLKVMKKKC